jgi:RHS repeat-associated protein
MTERCPRKSDARHFVYTYALGSNDQDLVQTRVENDPSVSSATTVTYGYNMENELTSAVTTGGSSSTLDYYYDAAGNRCSSAPSSPTVCPSGSGNYAYNDDNELTAGPTGSYTYDGAGNQITSPQLSNLTYNSKNQTTSTTVSGGSPVASTYAGADSTERTVDGPTTLVSGNLGIDRTLTSSTTTYFIRNNTGTPIGEHVGSTSYYYLHDNEGSVVAVITASGSTVEDGYAYDPYGKVSSSSGSLANPLGYAGGYTDPNGLVKFGTRYYNPGVGLFTQQDPLGQSAGYLYVGDDPVNEVDPSGDTPKNIAQFACALASLLVFHQINDECSGPPSPPSTEVHTHLPAPGDIGPEENPFEKSYGEFQSFGEYLSSSSSIDIVPAAEVAEAAVTFFGILVFLTLLAGA